MKESENPFHHEQITAMLLQNDGDIQSIIQKYCGGSKLIQIDNICAIITGNVEHNPEISGLVQLIHSELDADRIDYIMRDATFSGTSYGSFELGLFLRNLDRTLYQGVEIIGVHPKGISIADQFLINRYYSYTQVFFNRHVAILEFMAKALTEVFISKNNSEYPTRDVLLQYVKMHCGKTEFLYFTDRAFWDSLHHVSMGYSPYADIFQNLLLKYQELDLSENKEITITFTDKNELITKLREHPIYQNLENPDSQTIPLLFIGNFTKQTPYSVFNPVLEQSAKDQADLIRLRRLQEGIAIIEDKRPPVLLSDSPASLMSKLYATRNCVLREYRLPG